MSVWWRVNAWEKALGRQEKVRKNSSSNSIHWKNSKMRKY